jgi:hypothetical protein
MHTRDCKTRAGVLIAHLVCVLRTAADSLRGVAVSDFGSDPCASVAAKSRPRQAARSPHQASLFCSWYRPHRSDHARVNGFVTTDLVAPLDAKFAHTLHECLPHTALHTHTCMRSLTHTHGHDPPPPHTHTQRCGRLHVAEQRWRAQTWSRLCMGHHGWDTL